MRQDDGKEKMSTTKEKSQCFVVDSQQRTYFEEMKPCSIVSCAYSNGTYRRHNFLSVLSSQIFVPLRRNKRDVRMYFFSKIDQNTFNKFRTEQFLFMDIKVHARTNELKHFSSKIF